MKVAIITDAHFGVRGDSPIFLDHQEEFFKKQFFPYIDKHKIQVILDLGDLFDRRKSINFVTLTRCKTFFLDQIAKRRKLQYHCITGNHDVYYRNTNEVNARDLLLEPYPNIFSYTNEAKHLQLGSATFTMIPWVNSTNEATLTEQIRTSPSEYLLGHFDIQGFEMMKGRLCQHGFKKSDFTRYTEVWTGHFHHPSTQNNISYLGAPYEMNWSDYGGLRGFHVFDTEEKTLEQIINEKEIHHILNYNEELIDLNESYEHLSKCFVKLNIKNRQNFTLFDSYIKYLETFGLADLKVVDDPIFLKKLEDDTELEETKDTKELLRDYIKNVEMKADTSKLIRYVEDLYEEAISL